MGYDNLGQLRTENYPDTSPDKTYIYDNNGNLTRLQAGSSTWNYLYNSQNGVEKETLNVDGKSFTLDWTYNSLGAVSSLKYPSGLSVDYAPNALGQATKAGKHASSIAYYPNGQLKQMTFGNGITRKIEQDTTGRIESIKDNYQANAIVGLSSSYDYNDNLTSINDSVYNSSLSGFDYDGSGRLLSVTGPWGKADYTYDGLGNILNRNLGGSVTNYHYNNNNHLESISGAHNYSYKYDNYGNVLNNGRFAFTFNQGNQLTHANRSSHGINMSHLYDGYNRRIKQVKNGAASYSAYSQNGQLLYRQKANGDHVNNIYVAGKLIAETQQR
jgi:YD repeat-containing protein